MQRRMEQAGVFFVPTLHHDTYPEIDPLKADLTGKNVLISGASKGIGRATALSYARAGASGIIILARSDLSSLESEILEAATSAGRSPPKVLRLAVDIIDRAAIEKAAETVAAMFGHVDILINNAGYLDNWRPMAESDPDEWWYTWEVNLKGVYLLTRSFLPLVLKSRLKTIIMVSSVGAHLDASGASAYQGSKSAVLRLQAFLMVDYGEQGLLTYGIHPGGVATNLARKMPEETWHYFTDTPELAGDTLVFLTKERREWLADRYVSVNWDVNELLEKKEAIVNGNLLQVKLRL